MLNDLPRSNIGIENYVISYIQSKKEKDMNIAYIGANDGIYANPLYNVLRWKAHDINILISEPQQELTDILKYHLHFLQNIVITDTLVNDGLEKMFYSIKPTSYKYYSYPWLKNQTPAYFSPTIIASCNQTFFLTKYYEKAFNPKQLPWEDHVNTIKKRSKNLSSWFVDNHFTTSVDILLIMAQGEDATVLYHNDWNIIRPNIIICDNTNWEEQKVSELCKFLESHEYTCDTIYSYSRFLLATKKI